MRALSDPRDSSGACWTRASVRGGEQKSPSPRDLEAAREELDAFNGGLRWIDPLLRQW